LTFEIILTATIVLFIILNLILWNLIKDLRNYRSDDFIKDVFIMNKRTEEKIKLLENKIAELETSKFNNDTFLKFLKRVDDLQSEFLNIKSQAFMRTEKLTNIDRDLKAVLEELEWRNVNYKCRKRNNT
jgi:hypothetical protein